MDIGTELFAISAVCFHTALLLQEDGRKQDGALKLADLFCRQARLRIAERFRAVRRNADHPSYGLARAVLNDEYLWLEERAEVP